MCAPFNIEIHKNGKLLANAYYKAGEREKSILEIAKDIVQNFFHCETMESDLPPARRDLNLALQLLCATGTAINVSEQNRIGADEKKRFVGLGYKTTSAMQGDFLFITKTGMELVRLSEKARVEIDIGTQQVSYISPADSVPEAFSAVPFEKFLSEMN